MQTEDRDFSVRKPAAQLEWVLVELHEELRLKSLSAIVCYDPVGSEVVSRKIDLQLVALVDKLLPLVLGIGESYNWVNHSMT